MFKLVALAAYTKGGLGDVRQMSEAELGMYYDGMHLHADRVRLATEKAMKEAREK